MIPDGMSTFLKTFITKWIYMELSGIPELLDSGRKSWTPDSGR